MDLYRKFEGKAYGSVIEDIIHNQPEAQRLAWREIVEKSSQPSKTSFSTTQEYVATILMGAKIVQTITEYEQGFEFDDCRVRILQHQRGVMMAVVELPEFHRRKVAKSKTTSISPGDRGFLRLRYKTKTEGNDVEVEVRFQMEFIEPFPSSPPGVLVAKLNPRQKRPKKNEHDNSLGRDEKMPDLRTIPSIAGMHHSLTNKDTRQFVSNTIPRVNTPANLKGPDIIRYIMKHQGLKGAVDTVARHSEFVYVYQAIEKLRERNSPLLEFLASGGKKESPLLDIYSKLDDTSSIGSDYLQLNQSQKAALWMGHSAPAGFVLAHGGPGTGKTHFIVQVVKPFFLDMKKHQVLITSAGNRGADSIALGLDDWLQSLDHTVRGDSYVARLHSIKTETNIFLKEAEDAKRKMLIEKANQPADSSQQNKGPQENPNAIFNHYRAFGCGRYEGVDDDRVQHISLSVGMIMKQKLSSSRPGLQADYDRFSKGEIYTNSDVQDFHKRILDYMMEIIGGATAVCATVAGVSDGVVTSSYRTCEMIIVDEAARVPEYQLWPLFAFYPYAVGKIMVGDPFQMQPASGHLDGKSPLKDQMQLSLQSRLQERGFPAGFFDTQYRAIPEIAAICNNVRYSGRLKSSGVTEIQNRPLAQAVVKHNELEYGTSNSVVYFDVPEAFERRNDRDLPKYCNEYIVTVTKILEDLIKAGFCDGTHHATIAVLTPYRLEHKRLLYAKTKMSDRYPQAADIIIDTVDKIQGMEYDIVIIDPVVTDNPGFLDLRRLNVLFSRARCGLYVVANHRRWENMFKPVWSVRDRACPLKQFAAQLERYSKDFTSPADGHCPSKNEFYDPSEFEQVPETFTTSTDIRRALASLNEPNQENITDPIPKEDEVKESEKVERDRLKSLFNLHGQRKVLEAEEREKRAREKMERETREREKMERRTLKRERKERKAKDHEVKKLQKIERESQHREAWRRKANERELQEVMETEPEALEAQTTNSETPGSETTHNETTESGETGSEKAENKEKVTEKEVKEENNGDHSEDEKRKKTWQALGAAMEQIVNIFRQLD